MRKWLRTPAGKAYRKRHTKITCKKYRQTPRGRELARLRCARWRETERGQEYGVRYGRLRFLRFKKQLTQKLIAFRHGRITEDAVRQWAGSSHTYWVDQELEHIKGEI